MIVVTLLHALALASQDARFTEHLIAKIPEASAVHDPTGSAADVLEHRCAWSPDGTRVAWVATVDGVVHAAEGDTIGTAFAELEAPIFADDGSHYAFRGLLGDGGASWVVELDGEEVAKNDFIGPLAFAPDGGGLGFWEVEGEDGRLVRLDTTNHSRWKSGRPVSLVDRAAGLPRFSRDGKRMIAEAKGAEEHVLVLATRSSAKEAT